MTLALYTIAGYTVLAAIMLATFPELKRQRRDLVLSFAVLAAACALTLATVTGVLKLTINQMITGLFIGVVKAIVNLWR